MLGPSLRMKKKWEYPPPPWVYMLMHVSIKSVLICLLVCCLYMYMYVYLSACAWTFMCLPVHVFMCVRACVCMYACTYICIGPMCWSCILAVWPGPPPLPMTKKILVQRMGLPGCPSIHPLKIVKWSHVWTKCQLMHTFNHLNIIGVIMLITGNSLNELQMCENQCL